MAAQQDITSVLGWTAHAVAGGRCTVRDRAGVVQVSWPVVSTTFASVPVGVGETTLSLPEGDVVLVNGRPGAIRRSSHNGYVDLRGRRYAFRHRRRRRLEVSRDGTVVAVLRGRRRGARLLRDALADDTDRLAAVIGELAVSPGREGAISSALDGLSIV